jgi:hypothetical protein
MAPLEIAKEARELAAPMFQIGWGGREGGAAAVSQRVA